MATDASEKATIASIEVFVSLGHWLLAGFLEFGWLGVWGVENVNLGLLDWNVDWLGLGLLTLGEADDAAGDALALTLTVAALTVLSHWVLSLIVVIFTLIHDHGASNNTVRSAQLNKQISVLVLGVCVEASLDLLDIANSAVIDILVGVTSVGTEWVEDLAGGLAAVLEITELVDLEGVETWLQVLESTNDGGQIVRLLSELNASAGVGVSEEVEFAGSNDLLLGLGVALEVQVDWGNVVGLHIAGADGGAAGPLEAVAVSVTISLSVDWGLVGVEGTVSESSMTESESSMTESSMSESSMAESGMASVPALAVNFGLSGECGDHHGGAGGDEFHFFFFLELSSGKRVGEIKYQSLLTEDR